jgi:enamine deaminase RidA (YjgF/YER057c/UK114 family)
MRTIAIFQTEKQMRFRTILTLGTLFAGALTLKPSAACADVVRYPIPNSTFPIAQAVQVSGSAATYYVSGQVPPVVRKEAEPGSPQAYGDTKTQTIGVLGKIKEILEGLGLGMGDVVRCRYFSCTTRARRWISRLSWKATRSSLAVISPICRQGL